MTKLQQPTLELKNVQHAAFASEETHCYSATLYVDGKRFANVSNDGHGGADHIHPISGTYKDVDELNERIKKTFPTHERWGKTFTKDIEWICADLVNEWLDKQFLKKALKKISFLKENEQGLFYLPAKFKPTPQNIEKLKEAYKGKKITILNELPFDDALEAFKKDRGDLTE